MRLPDLTRITLRGTFDGHFHLRDRKDDVMRRCMHDLRVEFGGAVFEPNTDPELSTTERGRHYRQDISNVFCHNSYASTPFEYVLMYYLTDKSDPDDLERGIEEGVFGGAKYYPANGSTNSDKAVTELRNIHPVLRMLERKNEELRRRQDPKKIPFCIHPERVGATIDPYDAERLFVGKELPDLRHTFPKLPMVAEHISTIDAVEFVENDKGPTWATITPQHAVANRNIIFQSGHEKFNTFKRGLRPQHVCWPLLKPEADRLAIVKAIASCNERFGLGTDRAWHNWATKKAINHGCGGCYPHRALPFYAMVYDEIGSLQGFQEFACENIPLGVYGLGQNTKEVTLVKDTSHPEKIPDMVWGEVVPFMDGAEIVWKIAA